LIRSSKRSFCASQATGGIRADMTANLYWSKRGDVACATHAPELQSDRWTADGWCPIPDDMNGRRGRAYQCQLCAPDGKRYMPRGGELAEQAI
jgi:hypothetical protein